MRVKREVQNDSMDLVLVSEILHESVVQEKGPRSKYKFRSCENIDDTSCLKIGCNHHVSVERRRCPCTEPGRTPEFRSHEIRWNQ